MIFSFHFPWWREEGRIPQNESRDGYYGCHVTVYRFTLGLFGLQINFIGSLQRIDCCGLSIGCMQPLVDLSAESNQQSQYDNGERPARGHLFG